MFSNQWDLKREWGLPKTLFFPARQWEKAQRTLYHEPKVPFLVWVLPVADQNHSFISLKFSASSSTRKNNLDWENKWSKGAEARQVFHFFLATGTQHMKGARSCASPYPQRGDTHQPLKLTSGSLCAPSPSLGNSLSTGVTGRCPFRSVPFLPFLVQTLAPCARVTDIGCCPTAISAEGPSLWASRQISTITW